MKKTTALGMVAITIAMNITPLTVNAAGVNSYNQCYGGKAVTISGNCSLDELKAKLQEYGINGDCADWAKNLGQQNCTVNPEQYDCNTNTNAVLSANDNSTICNTSQSVEDVLNAKVAQIQENCNLPTETADTNSDTTQAADVQEETNTEETAVEKTVNNTAANTDTNVNTTNTDNAVKTTTNTTAKATTDNAVKDNKTESSYAQQVVDLVNVERAKEGLAPLTIDTKVEAAAMVRAKEIQTKFAHVRPDGSGFVTALKEQGVTYRGAGENIAWGQKTPEEVVTAWMNSPGHRANIMNKNYVHIGVGNLQNSAGAQYWVQIFTY